MAEKIETKFKIESWDEKPYREPDGERKFTRAEVVLTGTGGFGGGTFDGLMFYPGDGTSTYVTLMAVEATLAGRTGGFVLRGDGTFDGTTARSAYTVVEGSGTGDLAGISGTAESVSTHADYPYMPLTLRYTLA